MIKSMETNHEVGKSSFPQKKTLIFRNFEKKTALFLENQLLICGNIIYAT